MLLAGLAMVLPIGLVAAVGLAFAWPWLPRSAPGGAVLASYAPVANGDSALLVRYDPGGGVIAWESQNVAVVPGMRAMTVDLRKVGQDALQKFLLGETERDTANRLSDALVVEVRTRTLTAEGTLTSGSQLSLREARGDFLLSLWDEATDNDLLTAA
jgi:hypothetical protein